MWRTSVKSLSIFSLLFIVGVIIDFSRVSCTREHLTRCLDCELNENLTSAGRKNSYQARPMVVVVTAKETDDLRKLMADRDAQKPPSECPNHRRSARNLKLFWPWRPWGPTRPWGPHQTWGPPHYPSWHGPAYPGGPWDSRYRPFGGFGPTNDQNGQNGPNGPYPGASYGPPFTGDMAGGPTHNSPWGPGHHGRPQYGSRPNIAAYGDEYLKPNDIRDDYSYWREPGDPEDEDDHEFYWDDERDGGSKEPFSWADASRRSTSRDQRGREAARESRLRPTSMRTSYKIHPRNHRV